MIERRQHFRRRTLLNGRLEIAKLAGWSLDGTVRNLSDGGARLSVPADVVVPEHVGLTVSDRPRRPARLVWYREGQAGFALVEQRRDGHQPFAGPCRRAPREAAERHGDRLAARIAAISGRPMSEEHFTRP